MYYIHKSKFYKANLRHYKIKVYLVWGIAQLVKKLPAMQETWIRFLGQEEPLEKRNGNPLQYSCLETPMGRGAWQAADHEVARVRHNLVTNPQCLYMVDHN